MPSSRLTRTVITLGFAAAALRAQGLLGSATAVAAAVDSRGFIYLAGNASSDLPAVGDVLQPVPPPGCVRGACPHAFVAKLAPSGDSVVWATYWAGDGAESISALVLAPDGSIVIAGSTTSTNLLPNVRGYQTSPASLFIARLSADGKSLLAGTYFGGAARADTIAALRLDAAGNVYVAGDAGSTVFPTTPGAYQTQRGALPPPPQYFQYCPDDPTLCTDQFVAKFDPSLARLQFSTLLGTPL